MVIVANLKLGRTQSCGCYRDEVSRARRLPPADRFWPNVDKNGPVPAHRPELGECWEWTGSLDEKGYGRFSDGTRHRKAHDYSYEMAYEPVPEGLEPDHLCRNRRCVRPDHLEAVTHRVNTQRAAYANEICSRGHKLPEPGPDGRRLCRPCANRNSREHMRRKRAQTRGAKLALVSGEAAGIR